MRPRVPSRASSTYPRAATERALPDDGAVASVTCHHCSGSCSTHPGRGVAIGDAPPEVQEAADVVTDTFADGGPVAELRRWF